MRNVKFLLARIADPEIEQKALVKAIRSLGPATEEPGFWSAIANDGRYNPDHRRRAVYELISRHLKRGMTLAELAVLLDNPTWLRDEDVSLVTVVGGRLPVRWSAEDTIFILHIFPDLSDRHYDHWAAYIKIAGQFALETIVDALHGRPAGEAAAQAPILEIGLIPHDPSPDAD